MMNTLILAIEKVVSPVVLVFPDGEKKEFKNGKEAVLDSGFAVESICADGGTVVIKLQKVEEETDWIKEQIEKTGVEPNLFDGV